MIRYLSLFVIGLAAGYAWGAADVMSLYTAASQLQPMHSSVSVGLIESASWPASVSPTISLVVKAAG